MRKFMVDKKLQGKGKSGKPDKALVIGRKNWLISNTSNGADASAKLYSIVETGKPTANYMIKCMKELAKAEPDIDALLLEFQTLPNRTVGS